MRARADGGQKRTQTRNEASAMSETPTDVRALKPTKRVDTKNVPARSRADIVAGTGVGAGAGFAVPSANKVPESSVPDPAEETRGSARGAARVAARKAAHAAAAQKEAEDKASQNAAEKAAKKAKKAAAKEAARQSKEAARQKKAAEREKTAGGEKGADRGFAAGATEAMAASGRSKEDERALRFAVQGGRGDLSGHNREGNEDQVDGSKAGSSVRQVAAEVKNFDFVGLARTIKEFAARHAIVAIVLVSLVLIVAAVFGPAKTYYLAWRTGNDLQSTYDGLTQSNENLQSELERLQSKEGIEDEARKKGYVNAGETPVKVEGLPDDSASSDEDAEKPWYIQLGDTVFGYSAS